MANTVMNPCIPYVGPIPGGLQNGSQIVISGVPEHHHNGFVISLQAGPSIEPRSDTAFVFHVRFNESCVVRNTLQYGNWGTEERGDGFPFQRGVPMEVIILVKPHHYKVSVNGRHFCQYNHRLQKERVSHITVEQGLRVNYIRFEGRGGGFPKHDGVGAGFGGNLGPNLGFGSGFGLMDKMMGDMSSMMEKSIENASHFQHFPEPPQHHGGIGAAIGAGIGSFLGNVVTSFEKHERHHEHYPTGPVPPPAAPAGPYAPGPAGPYPSPGGQPVYNPPVPFVQNIPGGIYPGKMIYVSGIPHPGGSRFSVYLQHGHHHEAQLVGMVIDARFHYGNDSMVVVRNSKQGGAWQTEEKGCPFFPFAQNANFDMIIMVENHCYKVAVNNQHLLEFHHRVRPIKRVDTLRIEGDLRLTQVRFQ